jgi:hypothetical protein
MYQSEWWLRGTTYHNCPGTVGEVCRKGECVGGGTEGRGHEGSTGVHCMRDPRQFLVVGLPTEPEFTPLLRLRVRRQCFEKVDGTRFTAIQCSDFNLFNRFQNGEDITPQLQQRSAAGFNMLRVWTLYKLDGIGTLLNPNYSLLKPFLRLCAAYGIYVEFTAYTSTFGIDHWGYLIDGVRGETNVLLELVNENEIPVNTINVRIYPKPSGILCSKGSNGSESPSVGIINNGTELVIDPELGPPWDYLTFHTNGSFEEQRKVGHNAMELADVAKRPCLTDEISRYPEVGMWRGQDLMRQRALAYDSARAAALLCAGSCFHSVKGKTSEVWDAATEDVAIAWAAGAQSMPLEFQDDPYTRLDPGTFLRVYQRGGSPLAEIRV